MALNFLPFQPGVVNRFTQKSYPHPVPMAFPPFDEDSILPSLLVSSRERRPDVTSGASLDHDYAAYLTLTSPASCIKNPQGLDLLGASQELAFSKCPWPLFTDKQGVISSLDRRPNDQQ